MWVDDRVKIRGERMSLWTGVKLKKVFMLVQADRTTRIRHQCMKTTVSSCHRFLINTGVEKNEQHLNIE